MTSPWLTEQEAVAYLRMEGKTPERVLRRWVKLGKVHAGRRGRDYLYKVQDLDAFLRLKAA